MNKATKTALLTLLVLTLCLALLCLAACYITEIKEGKSAYQIWLDNGHVGSETDFLEWLKGDNGKSAYQIWLDNGNVGSEEDFLDWLKGADGKNVYEIYKAQNPLYQGTEDEWLNALLSGELTKRYVYFHVDGSEYVTKTIYGKVLSDIPEVPYKEGQISAKWDVEDFSDITCDIIVNAVYEMRKFTVTFRNEYTDDADVVKTVTYGAALREKDMPKITTKVGNDAVWSIPYISKVTENVIINAIYETQGLNYSFDTEKKVYTVYGGAINDKTEELFIPSSHLGFPITSIVYQGFSYTSLKRIYIANGITDIGSGFAHCAKLEKIILPNSVINIGSGAFLNCSRLDNVILPNSIKTIHSTTFAYCTSLKNIVIPKSVIGIDQAAFMGCNSLKTVFYCGNETEFQYLFVGDQSYNDAFLNATVYYYSQSKPNVTGNYWHYDEDGVTPVIWE